jgi:phenylacetate-coenzyme A ligase PaaK-like adenylate-forming protein
MIVNTAPAGSFHTRVAAGVLFPLHERVKGHNSVSVRRALERSQWWTPERLKALQLQRLQTLLQHAGEHVPYYRTLFARLGFNPRSVRDLSDLQALPPLTKVEIRANTNALKSDRGVGLARSNTGGSSGEPLIFYVGKERVSHDVAAKWRATRWWGVDIGDPEIVVWGSPIELGAQDRIRMLRDRMMRSELLPAFEMSEAKLDQFIVRIRRRRPAMLFGYPSSLALIAGHAEKRGIAMDDLGVKVAFVTSERLYDHQREMIARVFRCGVANGYGGRDAGFIAHECPVGGMHITAEDIIVEIIDSKGNALPPGAPGEVLTTHLATRDFPFIRYRTGDIAILDDNPCSCGRGLPLLKEIQGRTTDFVVAADGAIMHGLALVYPIRDLRGIEAFKLVQESLLLTRVVLVRGSQFDEGNLERIRTALKQRLGNSVEIRIEFVDSIPAEASGKFRYVVSNLDAKSLAVPSPV